MKVTTNTSSGLTNTDLGVISSILDVSIVACAGDSHTSLMAVGVHTTAILDGARACMQQMRREASAGAKVTFKVFSAPLGVPE